MTDFEKLVAALSSQNVEFIIVGGLAATAHGSARLTQDVDVLYSRSAENLERIVQALAPFDPYLRGAPRGLPFKWNRSAVERGLNFTLTTTIGDIDLLGEITGGGRFEDMVADTVELEIFGHACRCLDLPALIRVKRAVGRPKDLETIAELEALMEERERQ